MGRSGVMAVFATPAFQPALWSALAEENDDAAIIANVAATRSRPAKNLMALLQIMPSSFVEELPVQLSRCPIVGAPCAVSKQRHWRKTREVVSTRCRGRRNYLAR